MTFRNYQPVGSGKCHVDMNGEGDVFDFEIGIIETGRSRVFAGYYIKVVNADGEEWIGDDPASKLGALRTLDVDVRLSGGRLLCGGLRDDFYETGLSFNSGFGYVKGNPAPLHFMERAPLPPWNEMVRSESHLVKLLDRLRNRPNR